MPKQDHTELEKIFLKSKVPNASPGMEFLLLRANLKIAKDEGKITNYEHEKTIHILNKHERFMKRIDPRRKHYR